jgi:hypothetical protein
MGKKLEEFDESKLMKNPFSFSLKVPVSVLTNKDAFTYLPSDVEGENGTFINKEYTVEKQQFTRIYYSPGTKAYVYNLSDKAQRLFIYIVYNLKRKQDYLQINKDDYMVKNNVKSLTTYKNAIDELIRYGFIAPTIYKTVYWTNPILFSSSDRVQMYPDNLEIVN